MRICLFPITAFLLGILPLALAEERPDEKKPPSEHKDGEKKEGGEAKPAPEEKPKETLGSIHLGNAELKYVAQTGTMPIFKEDGTPRANVFYVYYAATGVDGKRHSAADPAGRPITFCFNGGPGAAAVWLHLGGLGPKRVALPPDGLSPVATAPLVTNPNTILDATDLVFVDPVSTGLSRAAKGEKPEQFYGVEEDIESVGEFIRLFTTREQRWLSPKYLCGESYGVVRAAGLADYLADTHGLYLNGVALLSGLLNFGVLEPDPGNDLPYILALPAFTATAFYHKKLSADLQANYDAAMTASRGFAESDYALALLQGSRLPQEKRRAIAEQLARYTGLNADLIADAHLRVSPSLFRENLLRKEGKILGRFDGRVTSIDYERLRNSPEFDPSFSNVAGAFSSAINAYVRGDLGYESDYPYHVLTPLPWRYNAFANRYLSMEGKLAGAMKENPNLRVLILTGKRDLAVPEDTMRYSIERLPIPENLRANIRFAEFESGHMVYLYQQDAEKLRAEMVRLVTGK